jgi:hypothetical protein
MPILVHESTRMPGEQDRSLKAAASEGLDHAVPFRVRYGST